MDMSTRMTEIEKSSQKTTGFSIEKYREIGYYVECIGI